MIKRIKIIHRSIRTSDNIVHPGQEYLYTEYKFAGAIHGIKNTAYQFRIKLLKAEETDTHINMSGKITEVLQDAGSDSKVGNVFSFIINKKTDITLWDLDEITIP